MHLNWYFEKKKSFTIIQNLRLEDKIICISFFRK